jgi:hypothetical protein
MWASRRVGSVLGVAVAVLGLWLGRAGGQPPEPVPQGEREFLAEVREWCSRLQSDLERLQEEFIVELSGENERVYYRRADEVLAAVIRLRSAAQPGVSRRTLYADFARTDKLLHDLMDDVRKQDVGQRRSVIRAMQRVNYDDEQLHFLLAQDGANDRQLPGSVRRLAHALAEEAVEFHRTAKFILKQDPTGQRVETDIRLFAEAAHHFHTGLHADLDREHLRRDFAVVNAAWRQVTRDLDVLTPQENAYLLRRAERVDQIHDRLFLLLRIEGERPRFQLRLPLGVAR